MRFHQPLIMRCQMQVMMKPICWREERWRQITLGRGRQRVQRAWRGGAPLGRARGRCYLKLRSKRPDGTNTTPERACDSRAREVAWKLPDSVKPPLGLFPC